MNDPKTIILDYLRSAKIMQLATTVGPTPWICTVHYVTDDQNNMYWLSSKSRQHSRELRDNPAVAVAVVKDPIVKQGLQMTGTAIELSGDDVEAAHALYAARYGDKPERVAEAQSDNPDARTYYKFTPNRIAMHDEVNFPTSPRHELAF